MCRKPKFDVVSLTQLPQPPANGEYWDAGALSDMCLEHPDTSMMYEPQSSQYISNAPQNYVCFEGEALTAYWNAMTENARMLAEQRERTSGNIHSHTEAGPRETQPWPENDESDPGPGMPDRDVMSKLRFMMRLDAAQ